MSDREIMDAKFGNQQEPHVSLLTIISSTPIIGYILYQIKNFLNY